MLRKTLTILSLIGLLLSVALWGVSYFTVAYYAKNYFIGAEHASIGLGYIEDATTITGSPTPCWYSEPFKFSFPTVEPHWRSSTSPLLWYILIPLWIPLVLFSIVFGISYLPHHRRRKRKKLGLCIKCGYDLRASKDRCPECGEAFEK